MTREPFIDALEAQVSLGATDVVARVVAGCSRAFGVHPSAVLDPGKRSASVFNARACAVWIFRKKMRWSHPEVARAVGGRYHSTSVTHVRIMEADSERAKRLVAVAERVAANVLRPGECVTDEGGETIEERLARVEKRLDALEVCRGREGCMLIRLAPKGDM